MSKKEKESKYASSKFVEKEKILGANFADYESIFNKKDIAKAYQAGWDEALKWISTEERMPEPNVDVIFLTDIGMVMSGIYDANVWMQMDGVWGSAYCSINKCWKVIAWMPIPSFDEILEANKDVLGRLKGE